MSTSALELKDLCHKLNIPLEGIYFKNSFPELTNGNYIFNMDNSGGSGTHWVGLHINYPYAMYFDAFGLPPPNKLESYLKKNYIYSINTNQIQNMSSGYCGQYVIVFLYYMTFSNFQSFIKLFTIY